MFADTAEFVGHENMLKALAPPAGRASLDADAVKMGANRNGLIERAEATGAVAERFALFDHNQDNVASGAELARGSGKRVTMIHLGTAHADDSSVLSFPDERAVFSADIVQVRRLPGGLAPSVGAWIDALRIVNALDFDHALTGHAIAGAKKDAADLLRYLEEISTGVAAGIAAGRSLADIQKTLTLDAYRSFERWDTIREAHIASVYESIKGTRR